MRGTQVSCLQYFNYVESTTNTNAKRRVRRINYVLYFYLQISTITQSISAERCDFPDKFKSVFIPLSRHNWLHSITNYYIAKLMDKQVKMKVCTRNLKLLQNDRSLNIGLYVFFFNYKVLT